MKRLILTLAIVGFAGTSAWAMNTDDIIALCKAGFEPEKIARIVDATGLDQPLEGADWARLKTEGCGDDVVDALLDVLIPAEEETEAAVEERSNDDDHDVNVYLSGDWGWNGWYGSLFWGNDPYWSIAWTTLDPSWMWHRNAWDPFWYDPWGYPPYGHHHYYGGWCDPFYYSHRHYVGGYYSGGTYARQKALRRAGHTLASYAVVKTSPATRRAAHASVQAKPYRANAAAGTHQGLTGYRKTARAGTAGNDGGMTARHKSAPAGTSYTTRSQAQKRDAEGTGSQSSGRYATRKSAGGTTGGQTATPRTGTRSRTTVKSQPGSSGTPAAEPKAKKKSSRSGGSPPQGSSYSPGTITRQGQSAAVARGSSTSHSGGSLTPRPKK